MTFKKEIGRISLEISSEGARQHDYAHGCRLNIVDGWNDSCPVVTNRFSVKELIDLRYIIDRALVEAEAKV